MPSKFNRRLPVAVLSVLAPWAAIAAGTTQSTKDTGPVSVACDRLDKASPSWTACLGAAKADMPAAELFYAGYWLARTGRYADALGYLTLADHADEKVLTYIGFATRKLGNVDAALPYYGKALAINPGYSVARAYLGEAYLSQGRAAEAKRELAEIETRCGRNCAEFTYLAERVSAFENSKG